MSVSSLLQAQERDLVSRLQLFARSVVDGLTVGQHRSPHKGFSAEFKEHRPYVQGDEIRSIDWKLYGKTDRLFIRQFEEETNLQCLILVDQSGSMGYQGQAAEYSKHQYAIRLAAALAYLLMMQRDSVGLGLVDHELQRFLPPRSNPSHLQNIMRALVESSCRTDTKLSEVLTQMAPRMRRRGLLVLISDCFDEVSALVKSLSFYRLDHNEVVVFQIFDRDELEFPFHRRVELLDLEKLGTRKLVDPAVVRKAYLERVDRFRCELEQQTARHRIDLVPCVTDQLHGEVLAKYLGSREKP